jgi:hypothetical protein
MVVHLNAQPTAVSAAPDAHGDRWFAVAAGIGGEHDNHQGSLGNDMPSVSLQEDTDVLVQVNQIGSTVDLLFNDLLGLAHRPKLVHPALRSLLTEHNLAKKYPGHPRSKPRCLSGEEPPQDHDRLLAGRQGVAG